MKFFRKCSVKIVYDSLYGISTDCVDLSQAVEILAYCLMDGKVDQKSLFETYLYNDLLQQLKTDKVNSFVKIKKCFVYKFLRAYRRK